MGQVAIHAGVIRRDHEWLGGQTSLNSEVFFSEKIVSARIGYTIPALDNGLGTASNALEFSQTNIGGNGKLCVDFYYMTNDSSKTRYAITCNSQDFTAALESTDAQNYVALAVASGSGYTLKG